MRLAPTPRALLTRAALLSLAAAMNGLARLVLRQRTPCSGRYVSSNLAGGAVLRRCYDGPQAAKCFFFKQPGFPSPDANGGDFLQAGLLEADDPASLEYVAALTRHGVQYETLVCDSSFGHSATMTIDPASKRSTKWHTECWGLQDARLSCVLVNGSTIPTDAVAGLIHDYRHASVPGRKSNEAICCSPYDEVISAVGWTHDASIYDDGIGAARPAMQANRKYARQTPTYESINVRGLFYTGSLSHARDWKKAAGGFIHGFRYGAKFLARVLTTRYGRSPAEPASSSPGGSGVGVGHHIATLHSLYPSAHLAPDAWPLLLTSTTLRNREQVAKLTKQFLLRINEASAPYQASQRFGSVGERASKRA